MQAISSALGFGKKGLGNWEALAQADPELRLGGDAMSPDNGMEMKTFSTTTPSDEADIETGGFLSSISNSISNLTGAKKQPEPEPATVGEKVINTIIKYIPAGPQFTYMQKMAGFLMLFCAGLLLLGYCFMLLPRILFGGAAKFAMSYVMANMFLTASSCFIVSPTTQLQSLFSEQRRWVTLSYAATTFATLWACLYASSMFIVLPLLAVQICCLTFYVFSYTPCASVPNSIASSIISSSLGFTR